MFKKLSLVVAAVALSACSSMVRFESDPPGATVLYEGKLIGVTPFTYELKDEVGWFSAYSFTATLPGYFQATRTYHEGWGPFTAQHIVVSPVQFKLVKQEPAKP